MGGRRSHSTSSIGIIYNDANMQFLCNTETNPGTFVCLIFPGKNHVARNFSGGVDPMDVNADSRYGIRSVRIDPYGENIAFGDRLGHIQYVFAWTRMLLIDPIFLLIFFVNFSKIKLN